MLSRDRFTGVFVPHITPFDARGKLDRKSLDRLARYFLKAEGVSGLVACARIGEGPVLSVAEKREIFQVVGEAAHAAGKVHIASIMPQSTQEAIAMIQELETQPVDAVMIFPPLLFAWGKVSSDFKYQFFADIQASTKLPVVLFQIPVSSYWYDAETVCRIARLENVVAYKEASFNVSLFSETTRQLQSQHSPMKVLTGNDRWVAEGYMLGAEGALIGISNLAPEKWGALDLAARAGDYKRAMALQNELMEIKESVFAEPIVEAVARIKLVLHAEGLIDSPTVRRPQLGVSEPEKARLLESFRTLVKG